MFDVVFDKRLNSCHIGHFNSGNRFRGFYVYEPLFVVHGLTDSELLQIRHNRIYLNWLIWRSSFAPEFAEVKITNAAIALPSYLARLNATHQQSVLQIADSHAGRDIREFQRELDMRFRSSTKILTPPGRILGVVFYLRLQAQFILFKKKRCYTETNK